MLETFSHQQQQAAFVMESGTDTSLSDKAECVDMDLNSRAPATIFLCASQSYSSRGNMNRSEMRLLIAKQMREVTVALFDGEVVANTQINRSRVSVGEILEMQRKGISLDIVFGSLSSNTLFESVASPCSSSSGRKRARTKRVSFLGIDCRQSHRTYVVLQRRTKRFELQVEDI